MKKTLLSLALIAVPFVAPGFAAVAHRRVVKRRPIERSVPYSVHHWEVYVPQIPGELRLPGGRPTPEIAGASKQKNETKEQAGSSACTAANANSPQCHTATQQGRGVAK